MKFKLDENLPDLLAAELERLGHDADTVSEEGLSGQADPEVWKAAQETGRFLITQDLDFSDLRVHRPGTHHGLLLVRLPTGGRAELTRRVAELFCREDANTWKGCLVVLGEHKVRVIRPANT